MRACCSSTFEVLLRHLRAEPRPALVTSASAASSVARWARAFWMFAG
jgi:hypothetical protein